MKPIVHHLAKVYDKDEAFASEAATRTHELFAKYFGTEYPIDTTLINDWKIGQILWIEDEETGATAAACLVAVYGLPPLHRINGLAVDIEYRRKGYASAILNELITLTPTSTLLEAVVDRDTECTEWLIEWYSRMGFEVVGASKAEVVLLINKDSQFADINITTQEHRMKPEPETDMAQQES